MSFFSWTEEGVHRMKWYDIGMIKWSTLFFTLMIAKLWPLILSLDWYWYLIAAVILTIRPMMLMFQK